jgi:hypothetical protein
MNPARLFPHAGGLSPQAGTTLRMGSSRYGELKGFFSLTTEYGIVSLMG